MGRTQRRPYEDKIYLNTADARIIALDMRTWQPAWDVQVADPDKGFRYSAAALIVRGMVISGLMNNRFVDDKNAITAHDARTGEELWRTRTIARETIRDSITSSCNDRHRRVSPAADVERRERLGGLLSFYYREAA